MAQTPNTPEKATETNAKVERESKKTAAVSEAKTTAKRVEKTEVKSGVDAKSASAPKAKPQASKKAAKMSKPAAAKKKTAAAKTSRKTKPAARKKTTAPKLKPEEVTMPASNQNTANFEQITKQTYQGFEQANEFSRELFDAMVQSSNIAATGYQDLMQAMMGWSQESTEQTMASFKDLMSCRSLNEFTEKQNKLAQSSLNHTLNGATQISEKYIKICTDAAEPLNKKITTVVEKASKQRAA
tara:strand:- start:6 stop:731 length:726 start_codon:yes stop_codon:yes gene_type:complete